MKLSLAKKRESCSPLSETDTNFPKRRRESASASESSSQLDDAYEKLEERCGKILNIHLTNFMCHSNLSIDFHKRVNFLFGNNGSGKSAIIAALVLGLGSNAKATNRSTNVKQFIKTGEQSAKIEITISNSGPCPYKKDLYGRRITVTRVFSSGSSTYTIKNEHGKIVSRKLDDLKIISLFHNIQVDNPIFVLNQDNAREFLKDFDPKKNYTMFMKATQLELIIETLHSCLVMHKNHRFLLKLEVKKMQYKDKLLKKRKKKLQIAKSYNSLKQNLETKECERLWLVVSQLEDAIKEKVKSMEIQEEKCNELKNTISRKDEVEAMLTQEISNYNDEMESTKKKFGEEMIILQKLNDSYQSCNISIQNLQIQSTAIQNKIFVLKKDIKEINKKLEESKNSANDLKRMRELHEEEEKSLKNEVSKSDLLLQNIKQDQQASFVQRRDLQEKIAEIRTIAISSKTKHSSIAKKLEILNGKIINKMSFFSENIIMLRNTIAKNSEKFSKLPKGPIGYYIDVDNTQYRDTIEHILGRQLLESFLVNNSNDRKVLENFIKQIFPSESYPPNIIQIRFRSNVYDTRQGQTSPTRDTTLLMNELKCSDTDIMNCLIDYRQIEQILLTDELKIASNICSQRENVPNNLAKIYIIKDGIEMYPLPKYRLYSINIRPAKFIAIDQKSQIKQLENELKKVELKINSLEKENIQLKSQFESINEILAAKNKNKNEIENTIQRLKRKLLEMDNKIFPDNNYIDLLQKAADDVEQQKTNFETKIESYGNEQNDFILKKKELQQNINEQKNSIENIKNEIEQQNKLILDKKSKLTSLGQNLKKQTLRIKKNEQLLLEMKNINESLTKNLKAATKEAEKKGERIPSESTIEEIAEEIEKIMNQLTIQSGCKETIQELEEKIADAELTIASEKKKLKRMERIFSILKKSLVLRFELVTKFKTHMVITFQHSFIRILGLRDFKGKIDVNHNDKTMTISVTPRSCQNEHVGSTKSLSGGERSYSTVAFLISLWSCVDHPFYFLDEYDVFTDDVNREFMTKLLVSEGETKINRQFCFSTPLDTDIPSYSFIKTHKLSEPVRN